MVAWHGRERTRHGFLLRNIPQRCGVSEGSSDEPQRTRTATPELTAHEIDNALARKILVVDDDDTKRHGAVCEVAGVRT